MPTLTVNNIKIYYEQHGHGDDLILIGGLTSDHHVWNSTLREFSKHFRVTIFDNRGAGQSDAPDYPYTMKMMADDTIALMNALKISRAHMVGHSMGGGIAQQIALIAPEKINKLVLVCSRSKSSALANIVFSTREKLIEKNVGDELIAQYMMPFLFGDELLSNSLLVKGFIQWSAKNPFPQSELGYRHQLHASSTRDFSEELHNISMPTLIIAGEEDILMRPKNAEITAKSVKNGTFVVIKNCAHMPHVEKSKEFIETVLTFLL